MCRGVRRRPELLSRDLLLLLNTDPAISKGPRQCALRAELAGSLSRCGPPRVGERGEEVAVEAEMVRILEGDRLHGSAIEAANETDTLRVSENDRER